MSDCVYNVLFPCTGNSARSIFGESLINYVGGGRYRGFSAGSTPRGEVHPLTLRVLQKAGEDPAGVEEPDFKEKAAFEDTLRYLRNRIAAFMSLPLSTVDRMSLTSRLQGTGAMDGTTSANKGAA